jgi:hypothetical protein
MAAASSSVIERQRDFDRTAEVVVVEQFLDFQERLLRKHRLSNFHAVLLVEFFTR